jgi:hypothetical protein
VTATTPAPTASPAVAEEEAADAPASSAIAWRDLIRWALVGTLGLLLLVGVDVVRHGGSNPVSLIQPGTAGPSTAVIARDFPDVEQPAGLGLDGQQYYAIARDPLHLDRAAASLDNPRYRLQRPLLPWLGWALHPTGGGTGLIAALFAVGLLGAFGGAVATGALSRRWGGPAWVAALFPLLPGAYWSLRVTVSDALALALVLGAVACASRDRYVPAVALGVLAVLAKEPAILVLVGWALHRRTRRDLVLVAVPALAVVGWMGWLAHELPPDTARAKDLGAPFAGLWGGWQEQWSHGRELVGMACTLGGLAIGALALGLRRLRHPLGWIVAIQLAFLLVMGKNPTSINFGATRMAMPLMVTAAIALATPRGAAVDDERP